MSTSASTQMAASAATGCLRTWFTLVLLGSVDHQRSPDGDRPAKSTDGPLITSRSYPSALRTKSTATASPPTPIAAGNAARFPAAGMTATSVRIALP